MSQENVEFVRRAFEAFNRDGIEAVLSGMSPEVVWDGSPMGVPGLGVYRGPDEIRTFFNEDWFKVFPFEEWELHADELIDHGDLVIAKARQRGLGAGSGAAVEQRFVQVYTFRDGRLVRVDHYLNYEKALEAVGLRE
jgi:ketosteroid isomerase-like protein